MTLEIRVVGIADTIKERYIREWSPMFEELASTTGVTPGTLQRVFVSDEDSYGPTIKEICPGEGFTNENELTGVGKVLPKRSATGTSVVDLVVRLESVLAWSKLSSSGLGMKETDPELEALSYALPHEMGHCRDFVERPAGIGSTQRLTSGFRVQAWAEIHAAIALSEYAACIYSARWVSKSLLSFQCNADARSVGMVLGRIHAQRRAYRCESQLYDLATASCTAFWFPIIQVAKLFGQRLGNPEIQDVSLNLNSWFPNSAAGGLIAGLENSLSAAWQRYPNCEVEFRRECRSVWAAIAEAEGFRFIESPAGDGVRFDTFTLSDLNLGFLPPSIP